MLQIRCELHPDVNPDLAAARPRVDCGNKAQEGNFSKSVKCASVVR